LTGTVRNENFLYCGSLDWARFSVEICVFSGAGFVDIPDG
jgi:hypothetical protein